MTEISGSTVGAKCRPGLHDQACGPVDGGCRCGCGPEHECATQQSWRRIVSQLDEAAL